MSFMCYAESNLTMDAIMNGKIWVRPRKWSLACFKGHHDDELGDWVKSRGISDATDIISGIQICTSRIYFSYVAMELILIRYRYVNINYIQNMEV
jgi:hypothetical protein